MEGERNEYYSRLGIEAQRRDVLDALLRRLGSGLVDHLSLVDSVQDFLRLTMDRGFDAYL